MNFFEHQEKARRQSRWIIVGFILVAILIVVVVDILVLFLINAQPQMSTGASQVMAGGFANLFSAENLTQSSGLLATSSAITGGVIGLSSLGKIASLRSGGGKVARDLGGVLVTSDTRDALKRRLYNVVEEIAIASGVPVPEVYVLEGEPGINAFAAGYSTADAAVAVTQGTLERLDRAELQGVIAHEFSHIFNGDMRINIRMMGVIFGIMVIAIIGRKFMQSVRYSRSSSRDKNGSAIVAIGLALLVVGYVGLFFARWMKSALSRQREYLADASAVQFTRDPEGIGGALKKIAAYQHASYIHTDAEEVSHMLFGSGYRSLMFATHPPLEKRIHRIENRFDPNEIEALATKLKEQQIREHTQAEVAAKENEAPASGKSRGGMFDINGMLENIGNPEFERIVAAALLLASVPEELKSAAHSVEWAPEVLFYSLLDKDDDIREKQMMVIMQQMGDLSESKVRHLMSQSSTVDHNARLPLFEQCYPTLKRRPVEELQKILKTIDMLVLIDNEVDSFEYLLSRLVRLYLHEHMQPTGVKQHGNKLIQDHIKEISCVISILAVHGNLNQGNQGVQLAQNAYKMGMQELEITHTNLELQNKWQTSLDEALKVLNLLKPEQKQKLIKAMATTVSSDGEMVTEEHEMLRAICSLLHVPLPLLQQAV